jgi:hypothetical protein
METILERVNEDRMQCAITGADIAMSKILIRSKSWILTYRSFQKRPKVCTVLFVPEQSNGNKHSWNKLEGAIQYG